MKKIWQNEWQGIKFNSFIKLNSKEIANSEFYNKFYEEFFNRYSDWSDLGKFWIEQKKSISEFIINRCLNNKKKLSILSIGCGLGIVEKYIYLKGYTNIEIHEISETPLKWIKKIIPSNKIHTGQLNNANLKKYDLIYMGAVDYFFDKKELISFYLSLKKYLKKDGEILLVSASFDNSSFLGRSKQFLSNLKKRIKKVPKGQLWGYLRTKKDYHKSLKDAGFGSISDGFIENSIYYIKGRK